MRDYRDGHDDVLERPQRETARDVGPQGAALILELQRLRLAFERDDWNETQQPPRRRNDDNRPAGGRRRRAPKKAKKRGMGRVIEMCLEQFGLNASAPAPRRMQPPPPTQRPQSSAPPPIPPSSPPRSSVRPPRPQAAPKPRPRKPVTLVAPITMDLSRPG